MEIPYANRPTYVLGKPIYIPPEKRQDERLSVEHAAETLGIMVGEAQLTLWPHVPSALDHSERERIQRLIEHRAVSDLDGPEYIEVLS